MLHTLDSRSPAKGPEHEGVTIGKIGDRGPEGVLFVPAAKSPNGKPLLIVGNETSGTTAILQLTLTY